MTPLGDFAGGQGRLRGTRARAHGRDIIGREAAGPQDETRRQDGLDLLPERGVGGYDDAIPAI
jgi:hypothetical protein